MGSAGHAGISAHREPVAIGETGTDHVHGLFGTLISGHEIPGSSIPPTGKLAPLGGFRRERPGAPGSPGNRGGADNGRGPRRTATPLQSRFSMMKSSITNPAPMSNTASRATVNPLAK